MLRQVQVFRVPDQHFLEGGIIHSFTRMLQKDAKILGTIDDPAAVAFLVNPKQEYYELHHFFAVALGIDANLCVDDAYCGIVTLGKYRYAVFHQPARTMLIDHRPALAEDKPEAPHG